MERDYLKAVICSLNSEIGFDFIDNTSLETLVELTGSFITEFGKSTLSYAELSGRTEPLLADVILAAVNMGFNFKSLTAYAFRPNRTILPSPTTSSPTKQLSILQAGTKQSHPPYIPTYLPQFPDPHAYIRTPTHKKPVTEYETIREKSASQKRNVEKALNKFITKSNSTESLFFNQENDCFPLIAVKPHFPPYLTALIPNDQVYDRVYDQEEDDSICDSPQKKTKDDRDNLMIADEEADSSKTESELIDNPYIRFVTKLKSL